MVQKIQLYRHYCWYFAMSTFIYNFIFIDQREFLQRVTYSSPSIFYLDAQAVNNGMYYYL